MNIFSKITAKTMRVDRVRTIVTIIGVILSTSMITGVAVFGTSFQRFLVDYSVSRNGNWHVVVYGTDSGQAKSLKEHEDVAKAAVLKTLGYAWFEPVAFVSPKVPYLYVRALSKEALEMLPSEMIKGRMPEKEDEIVIPAFMLANEAEDQQTKVGDKLTLKLGERSYQGERLGQDNEYMDEEFEDGETFSPTETRTFTVVGIYDDWPDISYLAPGYDVLTGPTEEETEYQDVFIEMKNPHQVFDFVKENLTREGTAVSYNRELLRWLGVVSNSRQSVVIAGLLTVLIAVIMTGSITLIYNAFSISLRERTVQFGLLSSIGATRKQLRRAMRYEAVFVSAAGIPLGLLAGIGGIGVTLHYIGAGLTNWIYGTNVGIPLYVPVWAVVAAALTAFVTIMISVWIPSRRIRKISPMEAIRVSADIRIEPKEVKAGRWVASLFGLEGMMAQKNYKRDRGKYRATVISLTMSIGLFTAAGLFNMYLLKTGTSIMEAPETDLEYTLYKGVKEYDADVENIIGHAEGIRSVSRYYRESFFFMVPEELAQTGLLSIYSQEIPENDTSMGALGTTDFDADIESQGGGNQKGMSLIDATMVILEDQDFGRFAKEQKVNVSDYQDSDHIKGIYLNTARQFNSETERYEKQDIFPKGTEGMFYGGDIERDDEGVPLRFRQTMEFELADAIEAVPDFLEQYRECVVIFIPESMYQRFQEEFEEDYLTAVYAMQCDNPTETFQSLEKKFEEQEFRDSGYLENKREKYETNQNMIIAIKVLTYGFIVLISLIAVANVFHTVSTNMLLRRKEFAMLRSMGMSPKKFRKMMNYECLIYGIRSMVYGFVFTVLVSAALYRSIGVGADVEYLIPWGYLIVAAAGVFGVVFMTMLYTMRAINKNNIVDELKMN